jgi:hypothetical protein
MHMTIAEAQPVNHFLSTLGLFRNPTGAMLPDHPVGWYLAVREQKRSNANQQTFSTRHARKTDLVLPLRHHGQRVPRDLGLIIDG